MMKKALLTVAVLGLAALGWWWSTRAPHAPVAAIVLPTPAAGASNLPLLAMGRIGAGGDDTIPARTQGRIKHVYFNDGAYAHRGDVLVKLTNYSFIIAPRDGFLGNCRVEAGQYVGVTTPITTISRRRSLMVTVTQPAASADGIRPGDSVRVWVATRPDRVVMGLARLATANGRAGSPQGLEILLAPGAPFRRGETACVGRAAAVEAAATAK